MEERRGKKGRRETQIKETNRERERNSDRQRETEIERRRHRETVSVARFCTPLRSGYPN